MANLRLPNPPEVYSIQWATQYTRALEQENQSLWSVIQQLQKAILPNYTTAQKTSLVAQVGMQVFDTTLNKACVYTSGGWQTITSA